MTTVTLNGAIADVVDQEIKTGGYQSAEDFVYEAVEALTRQKVEAGINRGLEDVKAGRCTEITPDNFDSILDD